MQTVDILFEASGRSLEDLAGACSMSPQRLVAILDGRWTPSPAERAELAEALGVSASQVSWGHTMSPRVVRYHRFGLQEDF